MQQNKKLRFLSGFLALIFIFQSMTISLAQVVAPETPVRAPLEEVTAVVESTATLESTPEPTATAIPLEQKKQMELGMPATAPEKLNEDEIDDTFTTLDDLYRMQSEHPYTENCEKIIKISLEGVSEMAVRFSGTFALENGYDTVGLYLPSETENMYRLWDGKTYTGTDLANETKVVEGDTLVIRFKSDETVEAYGWKVEEIIPTYLEPTPEPTVKEPVATEDPVNEESNVEPIATEEPVNVEPTGGDPSATEEVTEEPTGEEALPETTEEPVDLEVKKQQDAEADETLRLNKLPATMTLYDVDVNCESNVACMTSGEGYAASIDDAKWLRKADANALEISFADTSFTEKYYDQVGIYGLSKDVGIYELIGDRSYSGDELAGLTVTVPGNEVIVRLISDESIEKDGWMLADVRMADLPATTEIDTTITELPTVIPTITPLPMETMPLFVGATSGESEFGRFNVDPNSLGPKPMNGESIGERAIPAPKITGITQVNDSDGSWFHISWIAVSGASGYRLWVSTTSATSGYTSTYDIDNYTSVYFQPYYSNTTYYFRLAAIVNGQIGALSAPVGGRLNTAPPSLSVSKVSATQNRLSWTAVPGATNYRLFRSETSPTSGFTWAGNVGNVTAVITSVPSSTKTYYYKVAAIFYTMLGPLSSTATAYPSSASLTRPTLTVSKITSTQVRLSWTAVAGATGYRVWRSETSATSGYTWVVSFPSSTTATITNLPSSTKTYYYRVAALSGSHIGPLSVPVSIGSTQTSAPTMYAPTVVSGDHFRLSWSAVPGATGYRLYRSETSPTSGYTWVINTGNVTAVVTRAPNIYKVYYYRVGAIVNGQVSVLSNIVYGQVNPTTYRAVLVGNSYSGTGGELDGPIPDSIQMRNALNYFKNGTKRYTVNRYSDLSYSATMSAISSGFAGADANDVSLFFYSGHGGTRNSGSLTSDVYLVSNDFNAINVSDLKSRLDAVPGQKVVIIDACHSGGFIARNGDTEIESTEEFDSESFVSAFMAAFADGSRALNEPGYVVMTAARSDQYSWEMLFNGKPAGLFTYYLLEGMGWSHSGSTAYSSMYADSDKNKYLTFAEAFNYAYNNALTKKTQYAQMYPHGYQGFFYGR